MRRLVVYLMVGTLVGATLMPAAARAQEPLPFDNPVPVPNRDLTPYVVGIGAVMGVIAFNIAAPAMVSWLSVAGRSLANIGAVTSAAATAARQRLAVRAVQAAAPAAAAAVAEVAEPAATAATATATTAPTAAATAAGAAPAPASAAASALPIVPPLTSSMLAQAQIGGVAAAGAGAALADALFRLFHKSHAEAQ